MRHDRETSGSGSPSAPCRAGFPGEWGTAGREARRCPRLISLLSTYLLLALCSFPLSAQEFVSLYPEEPERYDSEYYLDLLTMRYDSRWREFWFGGDNVFRLRFGSLNVEQWSLDQELKFTTPLSGRFRFRFWMRHRRSLDESDVERNELELEYRAHGPFYLSLYLDPAFLKRENDIGIGLQRRIGIDRFWTLAVRVLDFANNFTYEHGDRIEGEENLYTEQPVRFSLSSRDEIGGFLRFGIEAFATNRWRREYRTIDDPSLDYCFSSRAWDGGLWMEYLAGSGTRLGLELRAAEYSTRQEGPMDQEEHHRIRELLPYLERDAFPAAGMSLRAGLQIRRERWTGEGDVETGSLRKDEVLPFAAVVLRFSGKHALECGYLGDRHYSEGTGPLRESDERFENRLSLAYELYLDERSMVRVIETIDLDREDWGQFSIHDHFFIQTAFRF